MYLFCILHFFCCFSLDSKFTLATPVLEVKRPATLPLQCQSYFGLSPVSIYSQQVLALHLSLQDPYPGYSLMFKNQKKILILPTPILITLFKASLVFLF